jgi:hypothetical protein
MKSYASFLLRFWVIREDTGPERTVLHVEHIQTGAQENAATLAEVDDWIRGRCEANAQESAVDSE